MVSLPPSDRWRLLAQIVPRFSTLAAVSIFVVIGSSLYLAWLHVGRVGALLETFYGGSLLAKVALITPLLLIGATNLLVIRPNLAKAVVSFGSLNNAAALAKRFSALVRAEVALAALALLAAAILTSLPPGRQVYEQLLTTRPLVMNAQAQDVRVSSPSHQRAPAPTRPRSGLPMPTGGP
jgi:putative copper export protein